MMAGGQRADSAYRAGMDMMSEADYINKLVEGGNKNAAKARNSFELADELLEEAGFGKINIGVKFLPIIMLKLFSVVPIIRSNKIWTISVMSERMSWHLLMRQNVARSSMIVGQKRLPGSVRLAATTHSLTLFGEIRQSKHVFAGWRISLKKTTTYSVL